MPIVFVCPNCDSTLRVSDKAVGCKTQCPQCGTGLIVPVPNTENTESSLHPSKIHDKQPTAAIPQTLKAFAVWAGVPHVLGEGGREILFWAGLVSAFFAVVLVAAGAAFWVGGRVFNGRDSYQADSQPPTVPVAPGPTTARDTQGQPGPSNDAVSIAADSPTLPREVNATGDRDETAPTGDIAPLGPAEDEPSSHTNNPKTPAIPSPEPMVAEWDAAMGLHTEAVPEAKPDSLGFWGQRYPEAKPAPEPVPKPDSLGFWGERYGLESGVIKRVGDVDVVLGRKFPTVYVPQNARTIVDGNVPLFHIVFPVGYRGPEGQFLDPTAGFIPVLGKPEKVEYASSDVSIVEVHDDGSAGFRRGGDVTITVQVAGESISVAVKVVEIPLNAGMVPKEFRGNAANASEVIECLGLPDQKTAHFVGTNESRTIDGIYYSNGIRVEHWTYRKYPGAVFAIAGHPASGWLWCIGTHTSR